MNNRPTTANQHGYAVLEHRVMVRISAKGKYAALSLEEYYEAKKAGRISPGDNGIENLAPLAAESAPSDSAPP